MRPGSFGLKNKQAFTLLELLVVVVGVAILAAVMYSLMNGARAKSRDARRVSDIKTISQALATYQAIEGEYPHTIVPGQPLVGNSGRTYLPKVPSNPEPWSEGACGTPGANYAYFLDGSTGDYQLCYCLTGKVDNVSGNAVASSDELVCSSGSNDSCNCAVGYFWRPFPVLNQTFDWLGVAASFDGSSLIVNNYNGYLYISTSSGQAWTPVVSAGSGPWVDVRASGDFQELLATQYSGSCGLSHSLDGGISWTCVMPPFQGGACHSGSACSTGMNGAMLSANGQTAIVGGIGDYLYTSTDVGATWQRQTAVGTSNNWLALTVSGDGDKIAVGLSTGAIKLGVSSDQGQSWSWTTVLTGAYNWTGLAMDSSGDKLVATDNGGYLYESIDGGTTWTAKTSLGKQTWGLMAISPDGAKIVAGIQNGDIYFSTDNAVTWTTSPNLPHNPWQNIAFAGNGKHAYLAYRKGPVYQSP